MTQRKPFPSINILNTMCDTHIQNWSSSWSWATLNTMLINCLQKSFGEDLIQRVKDFIWSIQFCTGAQVEQNMNSLSQGWESAQPLAVYIFFCTPDFSPLIVAAPSYPWPRSSIQVLPRYWQWQWWYHLLWPSLVSQMWQTPLEYHTSHQQSEGMRLNALHYGWRLHYEILKPLWSGRELCNNHLGSTSITVLHNSRPSHSVGFQPTQNSPISHCCYIIITIYWLIR